VVDVTEGVGFFLFCVGKTTMAFILGGGIGVRCGKVGERPRGRCRVMMSGVVVAGAGTNLGRAAVENLKARKSEVIALVSKVWTPRSLIWTKISSCFCLTVCGFGICRLEI